MPCFIHSILSPSGGTWLVNKEATGLGDFATADELVAHVISLKGAFAPLPIRVMVMSEGLQGQDWRC